MAIRGLAIQAIQSSKNGHFRQFLSGMNLTGIAH
jgi:hypothetical protein